MGTGGDDPQQHDRPPQQQLNFDNITVPTPIDIPYTIIEIVVAVAAVFGNSLVILVFVRFHILKTVTNYYVISLAIADLLVGIIGIPCAIATSVGLPPNFQGCLFMNSLLLLLCTSSIFSLVAVTVDRYWAIIHPLSYPAMMTSRRALVVIALSWVLASIVGLLPSMGWNKGEPTGPRCFFMEVIDLRYLVFIYFATILTPSAFMAVVYVRIYWAIKSQVRKTYIFTYW